MKNQALKSLLVCVIVCTCAIVSYAQTTGGMTSAQRTQMRLNNLTTRLNLTSDQVPLVQAVLDSEATARSANDTTALKAIHTRMSADMSKILTSDQMTKYNQMMKQRKQ